MRCMGKERLGERDGWDVLVVKLEQLAVVPKQFVGNLQCEEQCE